jgi:hypothetical protein
MKRLALEVSKVRWQVVQVVYGSFPGPDQCGRNDREHALVTEF